jgi:stage II sporulation protein R
MKKGLIFMGILVMASVLFWLGRENPTRLQQAIQSGDMIRLHVVAASDDAYDQQTKLYVRDAILAHYGSQLEKQPDNASMLRLLNDNLPMIEEVAQTAAMEMGYQGQVAASLGTFAFPDRVYGDEMVPAGDYTALRIVLGDGAGANWWCVMYPPLCFVGEEAIAPGEDVHVEFTSSIATWWKALIKNEN